MPNAVRTKQSVQSTLERSATLQAKAAVIHALPMSAALFNASGDFIAANATFITEFEALRMHATLGQWRSLFVPLEAVQNAPTKDSNEFSCARLKRWYRIRENDANGDRLLIVENISDQIEQRHFYRQQRDQLLLSSRMMSVGELTTTLAHELNQPLASIVNYLSAAIKWVERLQDGPPRLNDALKLAKQQAERAAQVVQRLREFVRTREPKRKPVAIAETAAQVLSLLEIELQKSRAQVHMDVPENFAQVNADSVMLEQVVFNLVKNAVEAVRDVPLDRRYIHLRARTTLDGEAEFSVIDTGSGLAAGSEQQIFTPFHTTKADGMGIGLSICRSIIEYHEGRLFFGANPSGHGAIFGFRMPHVTPAEAMIVPTP
jgi:C4-dicarboxylate-specific signal transduction histidine kinase